MENKQFEVANFHDIEHLINCGTETAKIMEMFPHYSKEEIEKLIEIVSKFIDDEWEFFNHSDYERR